MIAVIAPTGKEVPLSKQRAKISENNKITDPDNKEAGIKNL